MKIGLLILMGIPASGKTTLAKTLKNNYQNYNATAFFFIHISYDELLPVVNQIRSFEWKIARHSLSLKIEKLLVSIKNRDIEACPDEFKNQLQSAKLRDSSVVIIVDDNMYFKSMRYSLFQIARRQNISFCQVYINCPLQCALLRNSLRSKHIVPPHIIENMHCKIEPPNFKNNWEKYSVELDSYCDLIEINYKLIPVLNKSLEHPFYKNDDFEIKELSKLQCKKNVFHQIDIALRRVIGCKIKKYISESSKQECQEHINSLNMRKSEVLADIKSGNISLPDDILKDIDDDDITEKLNLIAFLDSYF